MTTSQKIAVAFALIAVVAYLGYLGVRDRGFDVLRERFTGLSSVPPVPVASVSDGPVLTASVAPSAAPTSAPVAVAPSGIGTAPAGVFDILNLQRESAGVAPCSAHAVLIRLAQDHADDMARRGYFSHTSPDGVTFQQRILGSGYEATANAENIGLTSAAASDVVAGWMDSPGHRANMLNAEYVACGIGVAVGAWQGMSVSFVVAVFGNVK